jgi:translin
MQRVARYDGAASADTGRANGDNGSEEANRVASSASAITEQIVRRFERLSENRDHALGEGRQLIRLAANSVRATHRGDLTDAERLLGEARERMEALAADLAPFPSLYWAGYVQDAMKEVAEAAITLAVVAGRPLPTPDQLRVEDAAYLNALAEAASELRRQTLDRLREDDLARAEALLAAMDDVYAALVTVDFPDAITGGLRRATDALRAVLERTRGDVTIAVVQGRVEHVIQAALGERPAGAAAPPHDDSDADY